MKTYRTLFTAMTMLFAISISIAQNVEKTLIKSFNLEGNDFVEIDLNGQIEVKEWNNSIMRIQVTVGIDQGSDAMLKSLVTAGRYNLKSAETPKGLAINAPGLERTITVRGNELKENITYVVFKPENVNVRLKNEASTSNSTPSDLTDL